MKTLIIAEKPKVAKALKAMLEAKHGEKFQSKGDFFESQNYYLSSFFGHLLELYKPDDYGFKQWRADDLPIIPNPMKFRYKGDTEVRGKSLAKLAQNSSLLINATDGDREGEGIFRIWYEFEAIRTPFKRIWPKALPIEDLAKAWSKIEDSKKYDSLAAAQRLRQEADWLIGMNGSRAYSIAGNARLSIGRVQTATLALIVKRDYEVENFKDAFFYTIVGEWNALPFIYFNDNGTKFEDEAFVNKIKDECQGSLFSLKVFNEQDKVQNAPLPFSLHELQKVANQKLGFPLDKTLELAQSLYEKELTTYPRTSSPYLPPSDVSNYYKIIDKFADQSEKDLLIAQGKPVQCLKETDASHTAIIPTGITPQDITDEEKKLYLLILKRLIMAFLKPRLYKQYSIVISNGKHDFRSIITKTIDHGYTKLGLIKDEDETDRGEEENEITWELTRGKLSGEKPIEKLEILKKKRAKPKYYTPATLLTAMINVGRNLENKEHKEILAEVEGLGTEATRDKVPVDLEFRGYVEKLGKFIKSTVKGRELIAWVKPELKTPELTAQWESKLRGIEKGKYDPAIFRSEIQQFTRQIVKIDNALRDKFTQSVDAAKRKCPKCQKSLIENSAGYFCAKECGFALWKIISEKKLSVKDINSLFDYGKTGIIEGFKKKDGSGKTFSAKIIIEAPEFKCKFSFDTSTDYTCPLCGGIMKTFNVNLKCEKCQFAVWFTMCEKKLTENQIKTLLTKGKTGIIKGFMSAKSGKGFEAALVIDKNARRVSFEFPSKCSK